MESMSGDCDDRPGSNVHFLNPPDNATPADEWIAENDGFVRSVDPERKLATEELQSIFNRTTIALAQDMRMKEKLAREEPEVFRAALDRVTSDARASGETGSNVAIW